MKKLLLPFLLILSQLVVAHHPLTNKSRKEIFLKSQLSSSGIRSEESYSVIGVKEATWQYVLLEFLSYDDHLVTIEQNNVCLYSQTIRLSQDVRIKRVNIPLSLFEKGSYTMIVINMHSGERTSGRFLID